MQVKILREAGYEEALFGLSLSFYDHAIPAFGLPSSEIEGSFLEKVRVETRLPTSLPEPFWTEARFIKAEKIARTLANKTASDEYEVRNNPAYISAEQKFLESIDVWIFTQASRDFWSEFDTYRVDMTKQSSSTMHTLSKRTVTMADFEEGTSEISCEALNDALANYHYSCISKDTNPSKEYHNVSILKKNLPEGWLQERVVKTSYKTLKWILEQRDGHRLEQWKQFKTDILTQLEHPEFITNTQE